MLALGGCAVDEGDEDEEIDIGSSSAELTAGTWTNGLRVTIAGNDLSKFSGSTNLWNAGASTVESLQGDGFWEFTTAENTSAKMAGLSNGDSNVDFGDIDFAIYPKSSGKIGIYESGVSLVANAGTYVAGDRFRVKVQQGVVTYYRNGILLYTSLGVPTFPLLLDASLKTLGATINDANFDHAWGNFLRTAFVGSTLVRTATGTAWNAGATSTTSFTGDGQAEFSTAENNLAKIAGLSNDNPDAGYTSIDYAIYLKSTGGVSIFENGVSQGNFGTYNPGDVFRVQARGNQVSYWRNNVRFFTSATAPTYPLVLDASLNQQNATITNATVTQMMTHSNSLDPAVDQWITCNQFPNHTENSFYRTFRLSNFAIQGNFTVSSVTVGVDNATAGTGGLQPATIKLHKLVGPPVVANLREVASRDISLPDQSLGLLTIPISGSFKPNQTIVVELHIPDGRPTNDTWDFGTNSAGQTAPSYFLAADCGYPEMTDISTLGFGERDYVMFVTGTQE